MKNKWLRILGSSALLIMVCFSSLAADTRAPAEKTGVVLALPGGARTGQDFNVDEATEAYINLLSEADRARSDAYMEGGYWLQLWNFVYGLALAWLLLGTRLSARMRNLSERFGRWRWLHTFIYGAQYGVIASVLSWQKPWPN